MQLRLLVFGAERRAWCCLANYVDYEVSLCRTASLEYARNAAISSDCRQPRFVVLLLEGKHMPTTDDRVPPKPHVLQALDETVTESARVVLVDFVYIVLAGVQSKVLGTTTAVFQKQRRDNTLTCEEVAYVVNIRTAVDDMRRNSSVSLWIGTPG